MSVLWPGTKYAIRRKNGQIWVRVFTDIPITSKPTKVRMGKGKGNSTGWIVCVVEGQILFEMGEGGGFPQVRAVVSLVNPCLLMVHPCTKVFQLRIN